MMLIIFLFFNQYNNAFKLAPAYLQIFFQVPVIAEGTNVSVPCHNFNSRPGFMGATVWSDATGNEVGRGNLSFVATRQKSGLYICSVPTVSAIPIASFFLIVNCKLFLEILLCNSL